MFFAYYDFIQTLLIVSEEDGGIQRAITCVSGETRARARAKPRVKQKGFQSVCLGDTESHSGRLLTLTFRAFSRRFYPKRLTTVNTNLDGGVNQQGPQGSS